MYHGIRGNKKKDFLAKKGTKIILISIPTLVFHSVKLFINKTCKDYIFWWIQTAKFKYEMDQAHDKHVIPEWVAVVAVIQTITGYENHSSPT